MVLSEKSATFRDHALEKDRTDELRADFMAMKRVVAVALAISVLAVVSGCGRKSGLDTPYEAAVQARKEAEKNKEPLPPEPEKPVEDKPFILDGLIK
jgi:predicted small lipoprotein YifL